MSSLATPSSPLLHRAGREPDDAVAQVERLALRRHVTQADEEVGVLERRAHVERGGQRTDHGEVVGQRRAGVREHVAPALPAGLLLAPRRGPVERRTADRRCGVAGVVVVAVRGDVVGRRRDPPQGAAPPEVPPLGLPGRRPHGELLPRARAHDEDAHRRVLGFVALGLPRPELAVEPPRAVTHGLGEEAGAAVRPRTDGQAGRAPRAPQRLVVVHLRPQEEVVPAADEAGRWHVLEPASEVDLVPPRVTRGAVLEPFLVEGHGLADGRAVALARGAGLRSPPPRPWRRAVARAARSRHPSSWFLISCSQASPVSSAKAPPGNTTESRKFAAVTWRLSARRNSGASCATAHCVMPR